MKQKLIDAIQRIQSVLSFEGQWVPNVQFRHDRGLGRIATIAFLLGSIWGIHLCSAFLLALHNHYGLISVLNETLGDARVQLLWFWSVYVVVVCTFHLLEFFVTAMYNPTVVTAESYLVNHSLGYTAAFLTSMVEFWTRFLVKPSFQSGYVFVLGLVFVGFAQFIRSLAMATAGESFNHKIQTSKKDNHVLVTHGIYSYLRHPSYAGFFYWAVGTQLLLNNAIHTVLFAIASCMFFRRRIPSEEESLFEYFPEEYPAYRKRTWIGIPFVPTVDLEKNS